jgi:2-oxoglutarate ferredoxin oxidoreductase subunit beta
MQEMILRAAEHSGTAFIEIFQNCNIFNDGAFHTLTDKETKFDTVITLEHDKPMIFGKDKDKGIILDGLNPVAVDLTNGKYSADDLLVHSEKDKSPIRSFIIAHMTDNPELPTPIGVFRQIIKPTYDGGVSEQIQKITDKKGAGTLKDLLYTPNTWDVS